MAKSETGMLVGRGAEVGRVSLPWRAALRMAASSVRHRLGRSVLTFLCIAVVVAFFQSSMTYQHVVGAWMQSSDVHTMAVLERAGVFARDADSVARQRDQRVWLLSLSAALCLVGITNTIFMSVTERYREIGTLKCLGAMDNFVIRLFLIESALVGAVASAVGAVLGYALGIVQLGTVFEFGLLAPGLCLDALVASSLKAVGLGTLLTLLASVYPTWVAARMKPVDAMRANV